MDGVFGFLTLDVKSNLVLVPSKAARPCESETFFFVVILKRELELFVSNFIFVLLLFCSKFDFSSFTRLLTV